MKKDTSYHDFIVFDLMVRLPEITSRRMMSGWCIYSAGIPFAAIIGDELYFKARGAMAEKLASLGSRQFSYKKKSIAGAKEKTKTIKGSNHAASCEVDTFCSNRAQVSHQQAATHHSLVEIKMAYWSVPEEMLDNQEAFNELAREVIENTSKV